jgi:hypothetical protein
VRRRQYRLAHQNLCERIISVCGVSRGETVLEVLRKPRVTACALVRTILLIIVLLAGLFWTWFGVASGIVEGSDN